MKFTNYFSYNSPEIPRQSILDLTESDLDDLYSECNEVEGINVYFHLLNELLFLKEHNAKQEMAHVCYLISYYVFIALTPPHSEKIAWYYADKAVKYDNNKKYKIWLDTVAQGN